MHRSYRRIMSAVAALGLMSLVAAPGAHAAPSEIRPKHAHGVRGANKPSRSGGGNGISYHGGRVVGTVKLVEIFYGSWGTTGTGGVQSTGQEIVQTFDTNFGASGNYHINSTYAVGGVTPSAVTVVGTVAPGYSHGTALSDAGVQQVVADAVAAHPSWNSTSTLWFVMGSKDVNLTSGYGTQYCGWHTHATLGGTDAAYAATIDANRAPSACEQQTASSPNGNPGIDGMISVVAHEIEETASDIDLNAWYDTRGYENADKCAWTFGSTSTATNGSQYNMTIAGKQYLIQRNWVNASGGFCAVTY